MNTPDDVWHLDTVHLGREIHFFDVLESTNTYAAALPDPSSGLAIIAGSQRAGRGRFDRTWQTPPGHALLLSVIVQPPQELRRASILTATTAVAVGDAVYHLCGLQSRIKWPNDLLIRGKKVCGILIEQGRAVVIGIGLNLNQSTEDFHTANLPDATSLALVSSQRFSVRSAAEQVIRALDREYVRLLGGEHVAVEADWKWRTGLLGRQVHIEHVDGRWSAGRLLEMSFQGLTLALPDQGSIQLMPESIAHIFAE